MAKSGGLAARYPREGFRSEYIAQYIFSAFGTSTIVTQGNDIGIDLLCNLVDFDGKVIIFKSSYGVQVKSSGAKFRFVGKQATKWLSLLEYPLLLVDVSKDNGQVKIYSTWNINRFLFSLHSDDEINFPDEIFFDTTEDDELRTPTPEGLIPVGKPILDFNINEIGDPGARNYFLTIIDEWLSFDNQNYVLRRSGVSTAFGYTNWETNKSLEHSHRVWYKPYVYSPHHVVKIKNLLADCFVALGYYNRDNFTGSGNDVFKNEFNTLRNYAQNYLDKELLDKLANGLFENEL